MLKSAPGDAAAVVARFSAVFDRPEFRAELDRLVRHDLGWGAPQHVRTEVLKAHRRRCTFDMAVKTESGWHSVIAKVHTVDRSDVFHTMAAVRQAGFGAEAAWGIPAPLAYLASLRVLLEEKVAGQAAMEVFLTGSPDDHLATAERCGRWLARFHGTAPRLGNARDRGEQFRVFEQWTDRIRDFGAPVARDAEALLRRLEAAAPTPHASACCAGHGSYMPEHVLLGSGRTVAIDLDEYDVADPSRDVAWFTISLQRLGLKHRGSLRVFDDAVEAFLRAYAAAGSAEALAHLGFHRAAECLHRARRDLCKRIPPIPEWAQLMLDEGLRALS